MKIRIEISDSTEENEIIIKCKELTDEIRDIQNIITEKTSKLLQVVFYKEKEEYYFPLADILFFEAESDTVYAHTANDIFKTDFRLYELQNFLPEKFVRVSKSAIVNTVHILSISKNIASSSLMKFHKSHKQIYVSRLYYKELKRILGN